MPFMQATVRTFDPHTRAGTVLLDDGIELPYEAGSLAHTAIRHLRIGQRVTVQTSGEGADTKVSALHIYTIPNEPTA
jgi:hypothetical protein